MARPINIPLVGQVLIYRPQALVSGVLVNVKSIEVHGTGILLKQGDRFAVTKVHGLMHLTNGEAIVEAKACVHNSTLEEWDQELHIYSESQECSEICIEDFFVEEVEKLDKCPFCHSGALLKTSSLEAVTGFFGYCVRCGATGPLRSIQGDAIAAWNIRA